ncbi:hypothetical protein NIES3974_31160 [Calothrix sp. NIES-3974]|nr:hypothetical protein NIES3974_31160 [Calothrix sp. NIES-3974]
MRCPEQTKPTSIIRQNNNYVSAIIPEQNLDYA